MKVLFKNINPILKPGMADFLKLHNITEAEGGLEISVVLSNDYNIKITKNNNNNSRSLRSLNNTEWQIIFVVIKCYLLSFLL